MGIGSCERLYIIALQEGRCAFGAHLEQATGGITRASRGAAVKQSISANAEPCLRGVAEITGIDIEGENNGELSRRRELKGSAA